MARKNTGKKTTGRKTTVRKKSTREGEQNAIKPVKRPKDGGKGQSSQA